MSERPNDPWTTESGSRIKAWYLMRSDLPMTEGKLAVQIGHGTDFIHMIGAQNPFYSAWLDENGGNRRKIILRIKEPDIAKVEAACAEKGLITKRIYDAGLTEFGGTTLTGLVVLPHDDANAPKSLQRAQAWKPRTVNTNA